MNPDKIMVPGKGAFFLANPGTTPPNYKTLNPTAPPTGWACLGHTSTENPVTLTKDGGEATKFGSWWSPSIAVTYSDVEWSLTVNALEISKTTLDLAFSGKLETTTETGGYLVPSSIQAVEKAAFILAVQGTKRMGLYLERISISLGDAPSFSPDALFEVPLSAQVLAGATGFPMEWFHPSLDKGAV